MIQNRSFSWVIFGFFALAVWGTGAPSQAQSANDLRLTVAQKYERLEGMAANFVQVANSEFMEGPERFSGSLLFSGPKYRIETSSQTIITDGKTLWVYNRGEKQVIINDLNPDDTSFSLTSFLRQFGSDYNATLGIEEVRQGVKHRVLNLEPKPGLSQFRSVKMSVRLSDTTITHLDIIDLNDVHMTIDLSNIKVNPKLAPESFVFVAPAGIEQIDLRN